MNVNTKIPKPIEVRPMPDFQLHLEYNDGVSGILDLKHLKGKGVFTWWDEQNNFSKVHIDALGNIVWNDEIDIDPLNCYLKLTNKTFAD